MLTGYSSNLGFEPIGDFPSILVELSPFQNGYPCHQAHYSKNDQCNT
jgi:hypothetical protein